MQQFIELAKDPNVTTLFIFIFGFTLVFLFFVFWRTCELLAELSTNRTRVALQKLEIVECDCETVCVPKKKDEEQPL